MLRPTPQSYHFIYMWNEPSGKTDLQSAAESGQVERVTALLDQGHDVNARGHQGATALSLALVNGHASIVSLLIEKGADVNSPGHINGGSPLAIACAIRRVDLVEKLIRKGADLAALDNEGATPLFLASQFGFNEIVEILLDNGADVNVRIHSGSTANIGTTPLIIASQCGHLDVVKSLLDHGANVNLRSKDGATAIMMASQNGHAEVVQILLESKADPNVGLQSGSSPLIAAAFCGREDIVKLLLQFGARLDAETDTGATALTVAQAQGHMEIVQLLKSALAGQTVEGPISPSQADLSRQQNKEARAMAVFGVAILCALAVFAYFHFNLSGKPQTVADNNLGFQITFPGAWSVDSSLGRNSATVEGSSSRASGATGRAVVLLNVTDEKENTTRMVLAERQLSALADRRGWSMADTEHDGVWWGEIPVLRFRYRQGRLACTDYFLIVDKRGYSIHTSRNFADTILPAFYGEEIDGIMESFKILGRKP